MKWSGSGNIAVYETERTVLIAPSFDIPLALAEQQSPGRAAIDPFRGMPFYTFKDGEFITVSEGVLREVIGFDAAMGAALYADAPVLVRPRHLNGFPAGSTSIIYFEAAVRQPDANSPVAFKEKIFYYPLPIGAGYYYFRFTATSALGYTALQGDPNPFIPYTSDIKFAEEMPESVPNIFRHPIAIVTTDSDGVPGTPRHIHIGPISVPYSWTLLPGFSGGEAD